MRWIPLLLTPIAVRNSFGMCAFLLYKAGVFWPYTQLGKHVAFLFGMGVAIAAYRRYYTGYLLTYGAFFLGIVSSIIAIYFAVSVGSHMALALASLWIVLFALSLYLSVRDASTLRSTVSA